MKNLFYTILLLGAVAGVFGYAFFKRAEKLALVAEANLQMAETERKSLEAEAKAAQAEAKKAEKEAEAAKAKAATARAEKEAKSLASATAKQEKENLAEKRKIADAEKAKADADRKAAEEMRLAEEAKKEAQALAAKEAEETARAEEARLQTAESARLLVIADTEKANAEIRLQELRRLELDRLIKENAELQETLRQREEATRPDKTIGDLIAENDADMDEDGSEDGAKEKGTGIQPQGTTPMTEGDKKLQEATILASSALDEQLKSAHDRAASELEALFIRAIRDGRRDDAEYYLVKLLLISPDYQPKLPEAVTIGTERD